MVDDGLTTLGLILDIAGVVLLFKSARVEVLRGILFPGLTVTDDGTAADGNEDPDAEKLRQSEERHVQCTAKWGISLLVVGFMLQILAVVLHWICRAL